VLLNSNNRQFSTLSLSYIAQRQQKISKYKMIKNFWLAYGASHHFYTLREMDLEGVIKM